MPIKALKKIERLSWLLFSKMAMHLKDADASLKQDREIVLAAVQQDGMALQYADESFKQDRDFVLATVISKMAGLFNFQL